MWLSPLQPTAADDPNRAMVTIRRWNARASNSRGMNMGTNSRSRLINRCGRQVAGITVGSLLAIAPALGRSPQAQATPLCPAELAPAINQIVDRPEFQRFRWGIAVETLNGEPGDRRQLYAHQADRYFLPASVAKLITTAAALAELGANYRIPTTISALPSHPNSTALTLQVVGRGDPSLTRADVQNLAQQLGDRGVTHIDHVILNDRFFPGHSVNLNWEWEDVQAGYGAAASSFILDENEIVMDLIPQGLGEPLAVAWRDPAQGDRWQLDNRSRTVPTDAPEFVQVGRDLGEPLVWIEGHLRVGSPSEDASISVPDPTANFGAQLQQAMTTVGLTVPPVTPVDTYEATHGLAIALPAARDRRGELARVESAPVAELIAIANQRSTNIYAEALLRHLGQREAIAPNLNHLNALSSADATAAGLAVIPSILAPLGVDAATYQLADGSGLSRHNLVSPTALVQTLQAMAAHPEAAVYRDSLAVMGARGTLAYRFQDTAIAGRFWGKSGTISGNASLAGYLELPDAPPLAIAILLNQTTLSGREMRGAIDMVLAEIARVRSCAP